MKRNTKVKQSIYLDTQLNHEMEKYASRLQLPKARVISFILEEAVKQQLNISFGQLHSNQIYVEGLS